jgi:MoaA/NifB/PqqE/SkfB family radical SAM enzyme
MAGSDDLLTHAQLMANLRASGCAYRWNYPVVKMDRSQIRTCCQVPFNENISAATMEKSGREVFLNSEYLVERKLEMLRGVRHADCSPCWTLEKDNFPSMRASSRSLPDLLQINPGEKNHKAAYSVQELLELARVSRPHILELQLDNVCDLACVYCNENYSTTWEKKLGVRVQKPAADIVFQFRDLFWDWYEKNFFELNGICIIGGEPLASPIFFSTLQRLIEIHSKNKKLIQKPQFLSITTNFNTRPTIFDRFLELLDQLKDHFNLSINGSCEAIGEKAEFIRDGLDWNKFNTNARALTSFIRKKMDGGHQGRIDFAIHAAQNALSISSLPEFLSWARDLEIESQVAVNLIQNIVSYPAHLSAQFVLTKDYARYCDEAISFIDGHEAGGVYMDGCRWKDYRSFLGSIAAGLREREPEKLHQQQFRAWYSSLESPRQSKFRDLFPDLFQEIVELAPTLP